ncbi:MAG: ABC transporter ATP-binding protein [Deltaproteobacteria bacterium]|nr:ABC transporter ATP-binding protein [Deltaproteobacteria bacterium]
MKNHSHLYWKLIFKPNLWAMSLMTGMAFVVAFFGMLTIGLSVPLINMVMGSGQTGPGHLIILTNRLLMYFGFPSDRQYLVLILLILISAVAIVHSIFLFFQQYGTAIFAQDLFAKTKLILLDKILHSRFAYFSNRGRGAILYDINTPAQAVYSIVDLFGRMMVSLLQALVMVGLMIYFSWQATLVIGVLASVWWWKLRGNLGTLSAKLGRKVYDSNMELGKVDVDAIDGIKVVKSHGLESKILETESRLLETQRAPKLWVDLLVRGVVLLNEAVAGLVVIALGVMTLGLHWIPMSFAELVAFMMAIRRVSPSLGTFNSMYLQFSKELKNLEVIEEILEKTPQEISGGESLGPVEKVSLEEVSFYYKEDSPVLKKLSFSMEKGNITAIVGSSGAGKSTLVNLLLGLYEPLSGKITVDGIDLKKMDHASWRKKVGFVSQDIFLFNDTLRNNISLWNKNLGEKEIEEAARLAQLYDFIAELPEGYETKVGDRGLKLSGGQCQRVAIAREILKRPQILIFDEATSALDNLTEKAVYEAISFLSKEAIVVVVAHRLTTIQEADQIVVLEQGKIESLGQHTSLLKEGGLYAQLYQEIS